MAALAMPDLAMPDLTALPDLRSPPPLLSSVSPGMGPTAGGTALILGGMNFVPGAKVTVAGIDATGGWVSATQMTATLPAKAGAFGKVAVTVTNPDSQSATRSDLFAYYSSTLAYSGAASYVAGTDPRSVAIGDLNGDGKADLAVANSSASSVGVLLNVSQ